MKYLQNKTIKILLDNAPNYRKKSITLLRLPTEDEIGEQFITYVADDKDIRIESKSIITKNKIIARNPNAIGYVNQEEIYNEWPIDKDTVIKNYGKNVLDQLTFEFQPFQKISTIKAIKLTRKILNELGLNDILEIDVDWSEEPMIAKIGDYITDQNYSISATDMKDYEKV